MDKFKFRPSARIIHTIGDNLIKDNYAAIVELVKNSYDADAKKVIIRFSNFKEPSKAQIIIKDDGQGMSRDDLINKWLILGTSNKQDNNKTLNGRDVQGRKGIGRFAASILGDEFILKTADKTGNLQTLTLNWAIFNTSKYLDEVDLDIKSEPSRVKSGTEIIIFPKDKVAEWDKVALDNLLKELRKILSPAESIKEEFSILFECEDMAIPEFNKYSKKIEPFPLLEYYDYRIFGSIDEQGEMDLTFINNVERGLAPEKILRRFSRFFGHLCAPIHIDLRVFDKDPESIDMMIKRSQLNLDKQEAKLLLKELCGISIFRGGFRIRPYGDATYDWVELDKKRVQDPSRKIGSEQIIGTVEISSEEKSKLFEKSARDGLKENEHYYILQNTVQEVIKVLADKRYDYRYRTGRGRKPKNISEELETLFDFKKIKSFVKEEYNKNKISKDALDSIEKAISEEEKEKAKSLETIKEIIAIYQGQITVGKIVSVLMHEGRKPLKYLKEESPRIEEWIKILKEGTNLELFDKILDRLGDVRDNAVLLINLFDRLNPLSVKKRNKRQVHNIYDIVDKASKLFESLLSTHNIKLINSIDKSLGFYGWDQDLYMAITNLFDNSIYWLSQDSSKPRKIEISSKKEGTLVTIDFIDNGPGIDQNYIEKELIFEPGWSTKPEGTGLGLAISGEAIERNNGKLKAIYKSDGAFLRIELPAGESQPLL